MKKKGDMFGCQKPPVKKGNKQLGCIKWFCPLNDIFKYIKYSTYSIGNTWWLVHGEAPVNPLVGYARNVSLGDYM